MKKLFLSLAILFSVSLLSAQVTVSAPNGGFENWSGALPATQQPVGWTTALVGNVVTEVFGVPVPIPVNTYFGTKATDVHGGSYALQLQSANVGITGTEYNMMFPGIAQLGVANGFSIPLQTILDIAQILSGDTTGFNPGDFDLTTLATLAQVFAPGDSCSRTPQSVNMWLKYAPGGNDDARIWAYTKSGGVPVGYAETTIDEPVNQYTYFSVPFEESGNSCDSIVLIIMTGMIGSADANTTLWVDDVSFTYSDVSVEERDRMEFHTYPNPATDFVCVAPAVSEPYSCRLYDLEGRLLRTLESDGAQATLRLNGLSQGVYMLEMLQNGRSSVRKVVVR